MQSALITGVDGFIGGALARKLSQSGVRVCGIGRSGDGNESCPDGVERRILTLPDPGAVELIAEWKPEVVFHCAGSASPARSVTHPGEDFEASVPVVHELLEALRTKSPNSHFVFLSSAAVYGEPRQLPISESSPLSPLSPYGYHKRLAELLCEQYATLYRIRTTVARIFSAYGPGLKRQVIWDAIQKLNSGEEAVFFGTGEETRDFIYVDDLVKALILMADLDRNGHRVLNVASGVEVSIQEIVELIEAKLPPDSQGWRFGGEVNAGAPIHWRADISLLQELGFEPTVLIEEGIAETVKTS